jgi:hypothetical protein
VRRIYVVFQDRNWTARPWVIEDETIEATADSFRITFTARGTADAAPFTWSADITGAADGTIRYAMRGTTTAPFLRNRLGLCVLHPMADFAGRPCTITSPGGQRHLTVFPDAISPHQPFHDIASMEFPVTEESTARLDFVGEVFETEDHRNWTDASYKTYCTPISLPFPVTVAPGDVVEQSVTLTVGGSAPPAQAPSDLVTIMVAEDAVPLPEIGTQLTDSPWTDAEIEAIKALGLGHLMVTIDASGPNAEQHLREAALLASHLDTRLRVRLRDAAPDDYARLHDASREIAPLVDSWMVLRSDEKVTARASLDAARFELGPDLPWATGTDLYFTELNREPADTSDLTWLTFSMNPQVHAFDDRTIMQNTATQEVVAEAARPLAGHARIAVGPITLRPRFNPNATDPAADVSNDALPSSVDARQRGWQAAAWTALSLRSLALAETVSCATYFEALGWRGLRERDAGSPDAPAFGSGPGEEFPVYRLLAGLTDQTEVLPTFSDQPEFADALVTQGPEGARAWLINLDADSRQVRLTGIIEATVELPAQSITAIDLQRSPE